MEIGGDPPEGTENGTSRTLILEAITELCREHCQDGIAWAASPEGKSKLRSIANDATFRKKRINPVYTKAHPQNQGLKVFKSTTTDAQRKERFQTLISAVARLPNPVTAVEAYRVLALDKNIRADQVRFARAMRAGGFKFSSKLWRRTSV